MARAATIPAEAPPNPSTSTALPPSPPRTRQTRSTRATSSRTAKSAAIAAVAAAAAPSSETSATTTTTTSKRGRKPGRKPKSASVASSAARQVAHEEEEETDDEIGFEAHMNSSVASKSSILASSAGSNASANGTSSFGFGGDSDDDDELAQSDAPPPSKTKGTTTKKAGKAKGVTKASTAKKIESGQTEESVPKPTRGRPPKNTKTSTSTTATDTTQTTGEPAKRPRGRPPANKTSNPAAPPPAASTVPTQIAISTKCLRGTGGLEVAPKKKKTVTFADLSEDSESENDMPAAPSRASSTARRGRGKAAATQSGLKAKPVRKTAAPPAASTATRGRKPGSTNKNKVQPLSPKKATQLAKSSSSASSDEAGDDEVNKAKNSIQLIVKSPTKPPTEPPGLRSPVKKINFTGSSTPSRRINRMENDENALPAASSSAMEAPESAFISSPARRLPPSPTKDTIRESPRRGALFMGSQTNLSRPDAMTPNKSSPLKISPKKGGALGASFLASAQKPSSTPFNAKISLLQSPAKRAFSPFTFKIVNNDKRMKDRTEELKNSGDDVFGASSAEVAKIGDLEAFTGENSNGIEDEASQLPGATDIGDVSLEHSTDDITGHLQERAEAHLTGHGRNDAVEEGEEDSLIEDIAAIEDHLNNIDVTGLVRDISIPQPEHTMATETHVDVTGEPEEQLRCEELLSGYEQGEESNTHPDPLEDDNQFVIYAEHEDEPSCHASQDELESSARSPVTSHVGNDSVNCQSPVSAYDVSEMEDLPTPARRLQTIPPPAPSPPTASFYPTSCEYREAVDHDVTDDEIDSEYTPEKPLFRRADSNAHSPEAPGTNAPLLSPPTDEKNLPALTPLADKLSRWRASSPEKSRSGDDQRSIFSPVIPAKLELSPNQGGSRTFQLKASRRSIALRRSLLASSTDNQSDIDDETQANKQTDDLSPGTSPQRGVHGAPQEEDHGNVGTEAPESQIDQVVLSSSDPSEADKENREAEQLPMSITPVRVNRDESRTIHTVSKVPLRPEGGVSPLKISRKRTRSLSGNSLPSWRISSKIQVPATSESMAPEEDTLQICQDDHEQNEQSMAVDSDDENDANRNGPSVSEASTPMKTPRKSTGGEQQVLRGVVAYVDVHTTEGEDASGIFVELLTQMGARCVRGWAWNPRTSLSPVDGVDPRDAKIGITHVIFKDGGVRTLEKVRWACDLVKCVGVGWVLDCEREQRWLDESLYSVDSSIIPRGGSKRRKSMQPRALCNDNGSLRSSTTDKRPGADEETVEEFLRLSQNTPPGPGALDQSPSKREESISPRTPSQLGLDDYVFDFDSIGMSPATPHFLSNGAKLIQQTCPPKQTRQGLFDSLPGRDTDDSFRAKLEAARRKSLFYQPKVGSPLGR